MKRIVKRTSISVSLLAMLMALSIVGLIVTTAIALPVPSGTNGTYWLEPRGSSAQYCQNATVDVWINSSIKFHGGDFTIETDSDTCGEFELIGDAPCPGGMLEDCWKSDRPKFYPNGTVFNYGHCVLPGSNKHVLHVRYARAGFVERPPGVYHLGYFPIHCNSTTACVTNLEFTPDVPNTSLTNHTGDKDTVEENGTFQCMVAPQPINVALRADGINGTIFDASNYSIYHGTVTEDNITINNQTAMGAVVVYCQDNGINVNITMGSYGEYVILIADNASDENNWMYAVNETVPGVGGAQYNLSGGEFVHWFNNMLNYYTVLTTLNTTQINAGDYLNATVTWKNTSGIHPLSGASVNVSNATYTEGPSVGTTGPDGNCTFQWSTPGTWYVYAVDPLHGSGIYNYPPVTFTCTATEFDTSEGAYPSIFGTHNGTITPNKDILADRIYTYPCEGTGGHTEYAMIWNEITGDCAVANWNGYQGDYHNISFNRTLTLKGGVVYNYTIRTGSYPKIHLTDALPTANGWINCTEFTDANGRDYNNWIPAIKLFYEV